MKMKNIIELLKSLIESFIIYSIILEILKIEFLAFCLLMIFYSIIKNELFRKPKFPDSIINEYDNMEYSRCYEPQNCKNFKIFIGANNNLQRNILFVIKNNYICKYEKYQ